MNAMRHLPSQNFARLSNPWKLSDDAPEASHFGNSSLPAACLDESIVEQLLLGFMLEQFHHVEPFPRPTKTAPPDPSWK
jgi:hypothetical protein